ncbi:putative alcohol dehydrogenase I [Hyaloraphidium curvatum]|nr:putative alcohol dehydrogenase I [Hyaloraphidium curvatum]
MAAAIPDTMLAFRFDPAAIKAGENQPKRADVPVPKDIGPDEVLIKIEAAGLCHSDLHLYEPGSAASSLFPSGFTLGHEGAGRAVKLGSNVKDIEVGALYAVHSTNPCRKPEQCRPCAKGQDPLCVHPSRQWLGLGVDGSWAQYSKVPAQSLVKVPDGVSAAVAAVATDAVLTPWHAILNRSKMVPGENVLVIGLGGLGLNSVEIAKLKGAKTIVAADVKESARQDALAKGATHAVDSKGLVDFIKDNNIEIDLVIDCVVSQDTFDLGMICVTSGGRYTQVGLHAPMLTVPVTPTALRELTINCCFWGNKDELVDILDAIAKKQINPVVQTAPLSTLVDQFHALEKGQIKGRMALIP